jgi:hypothetical protein
MIINFYYFMFIKNPEAEVANHLSFLMVCSQILLFSLVFLFLFLDRNFSLLIFFNISYSIYSFYVHSKSLRLIYIYIYIYIIIFFFFFGFHVKCHDFNGQLISLQHCFIKLKERVLSQDYFKDQKDSNFIQPYKLGFCLNFLLHDLHFFTVYNGLSTYFFILYVFLVLTYGRSRTCLLERLIL